jgi:hypothetical protein
MFMWFFGFGCGMAAGVWATVLTAYIVRYPLNAKNADKN